MKFLSGYVKKKHITTSSSGGRVTNAVGTIFRKILVGTQARPI